MSLWESGLERRERVEKLRGLETPYYTSNVVEIAYLTGKYVSRGVMIVGKGHVAFFVDARYRSACRDIEGVTVHMEGLETQKAWLEHLHIKKIAIDPNSLTVHVYDRLRDFFGEELRFERDNHINTLREVKDAGELKAIREAAKINYEAHLYLIDHLQEGISEVEAAWIFEKYARERGAERMGFGPTIAFGHNTAIPHHKTGDMRLEKAMPVMIDVGVVKHGYMSDMTRSFLFQGRDPEYEKMLQLVIEMQQKSVENARPGVPIFRLDELIRERFKVEGVDEAFKHSTGHGLGLELHEPPKIHYLLAPNLLLKEGMVITVEPGLYFDGKWGIRHEDTIIITKEGNENLYESWYRAR